MKRIDCRGPACPAPVLQTKEPLEAADWPSAITISVDNGLRDYPLRGGSPPLGESQDAAQDTPHASELHPGLWAGRGVRGEHGPSGGGEGGGNARPVRPRHGPPGSSVKRGNRTSDRVAQTTSRGTKAAGGRLSSIPRKRSRFDRELGKV